MVDGHKDYKNMHVIKGCFDINNPPTSISVANTGSYKVFSERNEKIGQFELYENANIEKKFGFNPEEKIKNILGCCKSDLKIQQKLEDELRKCIFNNLNMQEIEIEHEINLNVADPKFTCYPYRLNPTDKAFLEKNMEKML
ncbi:hypothetical protein COBT_001284 [Conglomerata obtusa]